MKSKTKPDEIWRELEKGQQYNANIDLYETVKKNENFFIGNQWEGVKAPDLEKPVLNFLRRVVTYFISMIVSDDVAASFSEFQKTEHGEIVTKLMGDEVDRVIEQTKAKQKNRLALRNAAVDGEAYAFFWFDPTVDTGRLGKGAIRMDLVDNTKVLFGNPHVTEVQEQPYILIVKRCRLEAVKERVKKGGGDPEAVKANTDGREYNEEDHVDDLVTTVVKMYKGEGGTVWYTEVTEDAVIKVPTDTGYKLYPLASMVWETIKNSYRGQAAITGLIPNQIFVNKLWAMAMVHVKSMAFPKEYYDATKIKSPTNRVGEAIPVMGDPNGAIPRSSRGMDMSSQVLELVDKTITYTRDFMGASDAALGNVKPDNTSAIIAVQKASSAPLELQRMAFYQFVEDYIRIIIDMIRSDYGLREVSYSDDNGYTVTSPFDFSQVDYDALELNVDVGAASYWSELTQIQTADNLFQKGIITDAVDYLESIPDQYVPHKNKLIAKLKTRMEAMPPTNPNLGGIASGAMSDLPQQPAY